MDASVMTVTVKVEGIEEVKVLLSKVKMLIRQIEKEDYVDAKGNYLKDSEVHINLLNLLNKQALANL